MRWSQAWMLLATSTLLDDCAANTADDRQAMVS
jgi:hypothetical protein